MEKKKEKLKIVTISMPERLWKRYRKWLIDRGIPMSRHIRMMVEEVLNGENRRSDRKEEQNN